MKVTRRHRRFRWATRLFLAVVLAPPILLSSCRVDPTPIATPSPAVVMSPTPVITASPVSGILRLWMLPADTLDPIRSRNLPFQQASSLLYDSLYSTGPDGLPIADLCTGAELSENGLQWILPLKQDIVFSDGTPFDAADAVASADYWMAFGSGTLHDALVALSPRFEARDERTLQILLPIRETGIAWLLRFPVLPSEYLTAQKRDPMKPIPGTGPYRILSYGRGAGLTLERISSEGTAPGSVTLAEYADFHAALEAFHSDLLDLIPLDADAYRIYRVRTGVRIVRSIGKEWIVTVFGTSKNRTFSNPNQVSAMEALLPRILSTEEFSRNLSIFYSGNTLSPGEELLLQGKHPSSTKPSVVAIPTWTPMPNALEILAEMNTYEAEVATVFAASLQAEGIPATARIRDTTDYLDAWMNGRYDIAIRSLHRAALPGGPLMDALWTVDRTPFHEALLRYEGLMLGPRVFGDPLPCADEIYRGIEDIWVWSGS